MTIATRLKALTFQSLLPLVLALAIAMPALANQNGPAGMFNATGSRGSSSSGTVSSVDVSGGTTGLTTSGGPVTTTGTITLTGTLGIANGGTGVTTGGVMHTAGYFSGNGYLFGVAGVTGQNSGTSPVVADTLYALFAQLSGPVTISGFSIYTSTSNASVDAAVKFCLYSVNQTTGQPETRLAQTTSGVSITNSATTTVISGTFDSPVSLTRGSVYVTTLHTNGGTGARFATYVSAQPWNMSRGATSVSNVLATTPIVGYTGSATYASGCPSTFPTATAFASVATVPYAAFAP